MEKHIFLTGGETLRAKRFIDNLKNIGIYERFLEESGLAPWELEEMVKDGLQRCLPLSFIFQKWARSKNTKYKGIIPVAKDENYLEQIYQFAASENSLSLEYELNKEFEESLSSKGLSASDYNRLVLDRDIPEGSAPVFIGFLSESMDEAIVLSTQKDTFRDITDTNFIYILSLWGRCLEKAIWNIPDWEYTPLGFEAMSQIDQEWRARVWKKIVTIK